MLPASNGKTKVYIFSHGWTWSSKRMNCGDDKMPQQCKNKLDLYVACALCSHSSICFIFKAKKLFSYLFNVQVNHIQIPIIVSWVLMFVNQLNKSAEPKTNIFSIIYNNPATNYPIFFALPRPSIWPWTYPIRTSYSRFLYFVASKRIHYLCKEYYFLA